MNVGDKLISNDGKYKYTIVEDRDDKVVLSILEKVPTSCWMGGMDLIVPKSEITKALNSGDIIIDEED